jgi:hypothetical protein
MRMWQGEFQGGFQGRFQGESQGELLHKVNFIQGEVQRELQGELRSRTTKENSKGELQRRIAKENCKGELQRRIATENCKGQRRITSKAATELQQKCRITSRITSRIASRSASRIASIRCEELSPWRFNTRWWTVGVSVIVTLNSVSPYLLGTMRARAAGSTGGLQTRRVTTCPGGGVFLFFLSPPLSSIYLSLQYL